MSSAFTFLVLLGLLNAQQGLEDPFLADCQSLMPGIDTIKLDFEMAAIIQAIEQYYANAELQRAWELSEQKDDGTMSKEVLEEIRMEQSGETDALDQAAAAFSQAELSQSAVGYDA